MNRGIKTALPPGVAGSRLGTLKICLLECTVPYFKSACLEFWGGAPTDEIATSEVVDMPLVGTISSLDKYLQDASPLPIKVMGSTPRNEAQGIIGSSAIPDISFAALIQKNRKPLTLTRRFRLDVCASGSEKKCIGIIVLDVSFWIDETAVVADDSFQRRKILKDVEDLRLSSLTSSGIGFDENDGQLNDASTNNAEGQHSLLEELLDLCADDMTIPTLPTIDDTSSSCAASNYVDPVDAWISRVEKKAASPIRQGGLLKIDVCDVLISPEILDRLASKICVYLNYRIKTKRSEKSFGTATDWAEEILLCEHASITESKTQRSAKKVKLRDRYISLMGKAHSNTIEIEVDDDEPLWSRLDGEIIFCISYVHSKQLTQENLKQKVLGYSKRSTCNSPCTQNDHKCLATGAVNLREVISRDAYVTVNMMQSNARSKINPRTIKVGSLSLNLSLVSLPSVENSFHKSDYEDIVMNDSYTQTRSEVRPRHQSALHPISLFLAKFANSAKHAKSQELKCNHPNGKCTVQRNESEPPMKHSLQKHNEQDPECTGPKHRTLQPVRPPPLWLSIVVSNIELGSFNVSKNYLKLKVSCANAISPVNGIQDQHYDAQCAWQLTLKEGSNQENVNVDIELTCDDSLNAIAHVEFNLGEKDTSTLNTTCLPCIVKSGWFDILDSSCKSQVGKIRIELSVGTLKHARNFPRLCKNAMLVQRWWRRILAFDKTVAKSDSECTSEDTRGETKRPKDETICHLFIRDSSMYTNSTKDTHTNSHSLQHITLSSGSKVMKQRDADKEEQTTHKKVSSDASSHFSSRLSTRCRQKIASSVRSSAIESCDEDTKDLSVSKQAKTEISFSVIRDVDELLGSSICMKGYNESTSSPDSLFEEWSRSMVPQEDEIEEVILGHAKSTTEHIGNGVCGSCESNQKLDQLSPEPEMKHSNSTSSVSCPIKSLVKSSSQSQDMAPHSSDLEEKSTKSTDSVPDRFVIVVRVFRVGGLGEIINQWCKLQQLSALPVSGLFISVGDNCNLEDDELRGIFCCEGTCRSRLISMQECTRELDFDEFNARVHVANCESNLVTIQTQLLTFKLWFIPVLTRAVVRAFNRDEAGEIKRNSLNGSSLVATASVPLYHLYTSEAYFEGKVAWTICGSDKSVGHISSIVRRSDDTSSGGECTSYEMRCERNSSKLQMSTIQPLSLQKSYSPEATNRRRIDPPPCSYSANKRKVDPNPSTEHLSFASREHGRSQKLQKLTSDQSRPSATNAGQAHSEVEGSSGTDSRHPSLCEENGVQLEMIDDFKLKVDSKEKGGHLHGLPSIESWESNKSKSKHGNFSFDHDREMKTSTFTTDNDLACNMSTPQRSTLLLVSNETVRETMNTPVQARQKADPRRIETCERGSSPILVTLRYANASTSPCDEVPVATTRKSFDEPLAKDDTKNYRSENQNSSSSHEENIEFGVDNNCYDDSSSGFGTKRLSNKNPIAKRLERVVVARGKDDNNSRPHRLRTQVMENYFERPNAYYNAADQCYKSTKSPVFSRSSSVFSLGHRVLSDCQGILRSPLRSSHGPRPCDSNKHTCRYKSITRSPTANNILSNRERIERIFSGRSNTRMTESG